MIFILKIKILLKLENKTLRKNGVTDQMLINGAEKQVALLYISQPIQRMPRNQGIQQIALAKLLHPFRLLKLPRKKQPLSNSLVAKKI